MKRMIMKTKKKNVPLVDQNEGLGMRQSQIGDIYLYIYMHIYIYIYIYIPETPGNMKYIAEKCLIK